MDSSAAGSSTLPAQDSEVIVVSIRMKSIQPRDKENRKLVMHMFIPMRNFNPYKQKEVKSFRVLGKLTD